MDVLLSYDVDNNNVCVKDDLLERGYLDEIPCEGGGTAELPESTLWKPDTTARQAISDLDIAAQSCNSKVEKAIAVEWKVGRAKPCI